MTLKLSILDQSVATAGRSQDVAIRQTVALAELAEAWGYHRFWVSEHHSHPSIVGTAPEVLMAAIAVRTQRIRLGSAGVMLPHYAALKVAEQFRVLEALAPGRIDLGVGRAPGSDGRTACATCHFHAGADSRSQNQLSPGALRVAAERQASALEQIAAALSALAEAHLKVAAPEATAD